MTLERPTSIDQEVLPAMWERLGRSFVRRVNLLHFGVVLSKFRVPDGQPELFDVRRTARLERLHAALDSIRDKFGHAALVAGASIGLVGEVPQDRYGYILRTPSLTK